MRQDAMLTASPRRSANPMYDRIIQLLLLGVAVATLIVAMPSYTPAPAPLYVGRGYPL